MRNRRLLSALVFGLFALGAVPAAAQGIVMERIRAPITPRPDHRRPPRPSPVFLKEHRIKVDVNEQVQKTEVTQVFHNPNRWIMEGVYLFPLPENAAVSRFTLFMAGKQVEGEVLSADRARQIYRSIVHRRRDPGLLEYVGRGCLRASIFPIPARGDMKITLTYVQVLKQSGGLVEVVYPLRSNHFSLHPVAQSGEITVRAKAGVSTVFSPTHTLDVARRSGDVVRASFEERGSRGDRDFRLVYGLGKKDFGLSVLSHKPAGEHGTFLILLSPRADYKGAEVLPKDVVFVFDTSGSMAGKKMEQAKKALKYALNRLDPRDRFNVINFATEARTFRNAPVPANEENVKAALAYADELVAAGGTAIDEALTKALALERNDGRVPIVLFLTDGLPTVGETNVPTILKRAQKRNLAKARLFVFGVGDDVNTRLLEDLAAGSRGLGHYVSEKEDIEVKVSTLYDQIASPVLTDVHLTVDGLGEYDVLPQRIGDLFKGQQIVLAGRYKNPGHRAVRLKGKINAREVEFVYESNFTAKAEDPYLPRLWAVRMVGFLMDQIRRNGPQKELVAEVKRLGTRYGLVTPYTSYLVVEDERMLRRDFRFRAFGRPPAGVGGGRGGGGAATPEEDAVLEELEAADDGGGEGGGLLPAREPALKKLRDALELRKESGKDAVNAAKTLHFLARKAKGKRTGRGIKIVGDKSFRYRNGVWVDQSLPSTYTATKVAWLSDDYDKLLDDSQLARYLSVGARVIVAHEGKIYEITG